MVLCLSVYFIRSVCLNQQGNKLLDVVKQGGIPSKRRMGGKLLANKLQDITCLLPDAHTDN